MMAWRCSGVKAPWTRMAVSGPILSSTVMGLSGGASFPLPFRGMLPAIPTAGDHVLTGVHPLGIIEVRLRDVQLLKPVLNRDTVLLAIVRDLLDLFTCHHNCYDCNG